MEFSTGYAMSWVLGIIVGGFTYLKIDIGQLNGAIVSIVVAAASGFSGMVGKYLFDLKGKKLLDKLFKKRRHRKP